MQYFDQRTGNLRKCVRSEETCPQGALEAYLRTLEEPLGQRFEGDDVFYQRFLKKHPRQAGVCRSVRDEFCRKIRGATLYSRPCAALFCGASRAPVVAGYLRRARSPAPSAVQTTAALSTRSQRFGLSVGAYGGVISASSVCDVILKLKNAIVKKYYAKIFAPG